MQPAAKEFPRPIPNSYWVEAGRLLAGEYPGSEQPEEARQRMDAFLKTGIGTFIDLTQPHELVPYETILHAQAKVHGLAATYKRMPVKDFGLPSAESMTAILDTVDAALQAGRKVYVHCWGGVGRTGTTIGCYLVRHGYTGKEALAQIATWWREMPKRVYHPRSPETEEQIRFILNWKEYQQ